MRAFESGSKCRLSATADGYSSLRSVHFGLGSLQRVDSVEITWPNNSKQVLKDVATNQVLVVKEQ